MKFSGSMPRAVRIAILILAIIATLGVSAASVSSAHLHENSPGTVCDICFTAHAVTYQTSAIIQPLLAPQARPDCLIAAPVIAGYQFLLSRSSFSRGPPSRSL